MDIKTLEKLVSYDPDTGILRWKERSLESCASERSMKAFNTTYAGKEAGSISNSHTEMVNGYYKRKCCLNKENYLAHRIAWALHYKQWPSDSIDHINGNTLDNRIENLREANHIVNGKNKTRPSNNTSGFMGVSRTNNGKWYACVRLNGKTKSLGKFSNIEDAVAARAAANIEYGFHENHGRELVEHDGHQEICR